MTLQKGICEECKKEYEYEYNPKYPRKYCPECSAIKKAQYENSQFENKPLHVPVVKPGVTLNDSQVKEFNQQGKKSTTMYVSYAKDLIVSGKTPEEAIKIISDLKTYFS